MFHHFVVVDDLISERSIEVQFFDCSISSRSTVDVLTQNRSLSPQLIISKVISFALTSENTIGESCASLRFSLLKPNEQTENKSKWSTNASRTTTLGSIGCKIGIAKIAVDN